MKRLVGKQDEIVAQLVADRLKSQENQTKVDEAVADILATVREKGR